MPWSISEDEMRQALKDIFGDDGDGSDGAGTSPAPQMPMGAPAADPGNPTVSTDQQVLPSSYTADKVLPGTANGASQPSSMPVQPRPGDMALAALSRFYGNGAETSSPTIYNSYAGQVLPSLPQASQVNLSPAAPTGGYGSDTAIATSTDPAPKDKAYGYKAMDALNAELKSKNILGTIFPEFNSALKAWGNTAQPFQKQYDTEFSSRIFAVPGGWQIGPAYSDGSRCSLGPRCTGSPLGGDVPGGVYWAYIHTHPDNSGPGMDQEDVNIAKVQDVGGYVSLPNGDIYGVAEGMPSLYDQFIISRKP
jgi:hypothetical protein